MPFVQAFNASSVYGLPERVVLTDSSTGSDGSIASRSVTIQTQDGTKLVNARTWSLGSNTINLDVLDYDQAVDITVNWLSGAGAVLYTTTTLCQFDQYNSQFSVDLSRAIVSDPSIMQDKDYWLNRIKLCVNIDDAEQAVSLADDIGLAQAANDRATYLRLHESNYF